MTEFEINGRKFKVGKLNAFKQFHIVRRISPVLADLLPAIKDFQRFQKVQGNKTEDQKLDEVATVLGPILTGFSKLKDADSEFVLLGLLSVAEMNGPGPGWSKVATDSMLMIQDLELPILLQIAGRVFLENLASFFRVLPQVS